MKARDIMSVNVVSVGPDDTVAHAAELMMSSGVSGLPVLADDGVLMGIITEGDLMGRSALKGEDTWRRHPAAGGPEALQDYVKSHGMLVKDVMSRDVVTADLEATLPEIAELLACHHVKRVLVLRGERVAGVVSRADLIRGMVTSQQADTVSGSEEVRREVLNRLHVELGLSRSDTGATIRDGKVVLWGTVGSEEELRAARVAAESVPGAKQVVSYMRLIRKPPAA